MTDLSLVFLDDIWVELCKRYDACIFSYIKDLDGKKEAMQGNYAGGRATAIGLSEYMKHTILEDIRRDEEEND